MKSIALILSSILVFAPLAHADPPVTRHMPLEGVDGVWVEMDLARSALGCLDAVEPTARQIRLLEAELVLRRENETSLRASYVTIAARAASAERALRRPRRNPWLWLSIGLVLGIGSSVAITLGR